MRNTLEALTWLGYTIAATIVLSVVVGIGLLIVAITTIGGAIFCAVALVGLVAAKLKNSFERS